MADDIDIEEHDLLDNPKIKNIFPDVTCIKTEVIEPDEEEIEDDFVLNYEDDVPMEIDETSSYQNKIILGSKPCSLASGTNTPEPEMQGTSQNVDGSKTNLDDNAYYCGDCKISFPNNIDLDSHKATVHSFLVAVKRNKAIKSTTKGSIFTRKIKLETDPVEDQSVFCNHCNNYFPNEIALIKHSYELLPGCFKCDSCDMEFENDEDLKIHEATHSMSDKYVCCPICTCHFRNKDKLATHMSMFHEVVKEILSPSGQIDFKCNNCGTVLPDCKRYNQHIQQKHPDLYNKVVDDENDKYDCLPSKVTSPYTFLEKIPKSSQRSKILENKQEMEESEEIPSTSAVIEDQKEFVTMPVSNLFKCTKCQVNFLSITYAVEHFKICESKKGNFKCKICRRFIQKSDKPYHLKQHELCDRLKSIKIRDVLILNKIVCVCRTCQVCYDEKGFQKCHRDECNSKNNVECSLCGLIIDEDYMLKHSNAHATGVKTTDFIEVDYMSLNTIKEESSYDVEKAEMDRSAKPKHLFYCPSCKCYLKINRTAHGHSDGTCNKNTNSYLCKICGLRFTTKGMNTHKKEHKIYTNLKLRDMKFTNAQSGNRIDPPFPIFRKCKHCSVHFFSGVARRSHVCYSEVHKTCDYCTEKFSDVAFKLHIQFHKYAKQDKKIIDKTPNISEILKTYESLQTIWNILYLCETCDTIIDTYDTIVEHCQDHFCNMNNYNANINNCNKCKLKFLGNSFDRHKELHAENDINKNSFIILKFNYEKLLTEEWSRTFDSLAKEQVVQILSKSIYQITRNIRMEIAVDGPTNLTIYKCGICNTIIKSTSIVEHAQKNNCTHYSTRYHCQKCNLVFSGRNMKTEHDRLHERRKLNSNSYRIIVFNSKKDAYINDVLRSKLRPAGLHFKRCQQCGKLIKKEKFNKHYWHHIYYQKIKMKKKQLKASVRPNLGRMVHTFYTCRRCKISVLLKHTVKIHYCNDAVTLTRCTKCSLMIRSSSLQRHLNYHNKYPKMTRSDINIVYFQNKNKNKAIIPLLDRTENNELVFYQCVHCSIAVQREVNVKHHKCYTKYNRKFCSLCEMPFHSAHIAFHNRLHDQISFSKAQIVIIKFKDGVILNNVAKMNSNINEINSERFLLRNNEINKKVKKRCLSRRKDCDINHELTDIEFYRLIAYRFYKCSICKLLFITGSALAEHQTSCREDNNAVQCNDCGLIFHSSMIKYHINFQKCKAIKTNIYIISLGLDIATFNHRNMVYFCQQCDVYNISLRGIIYHLNVNHKIVRKTVKCTTCDITFTSVSYGIHRRLHHYKKNVNFNNLVVATVEIMTLENALNHLPNKNEIKLINLEDISGFDTLDHEKPSKRKHSTSEEEEEEEEEDEEEQEEEAEKEEKKKEESEQPKTDENDIQQPFLPPNVIEAFDGSKLYKCDFCNLHFLHPKTRRRHMDIDSHDEERYNCTKCNLMFTKISYTRHMYTHDRYITHTRERGGNSSKYRNKLKPRRGQDNLVEVEDSLQSTRREEATVFRESPSNSVQRVQDNANRDRIVRSELNNTKMELFKCGDCDVYFLRDDICRDHITNHTPLDPTEYIACKMCDLQFPCEYLGSHMRTHRDKSFNIDNLIVTEYQIQNRLEINVDTYSAADRLKSKLVSTTTHFDTEDEKNTIDSTTDRLDVASLNSNQSGMRSSTSQNNSPMCIDS